MHLIDTGGPGGAETVFTQLAQRMSSFTRTLAVVPTENWLAKQLRATSIDPIVLSAKGSFNLQYLGRLVTIARQHDVKLVQTHLLGSAVYGALLGMVTRTPVVSVIHGPTDLRGPGRLASIKALLLRHCCSRLIAVSTGTRASLLDFGIPPESIMLIRNGVDTAHFLPGRADSLRSELGLTDQDVLIGAVGNIRAPKAYDDLLAAAALALSDHHRFHLAIIGQGDEVALRSLQALADSLGIGKQCHLLGFRPGNPQLYRNFDVFVSSSRSEGLSLAFLEAMATGLPVVATRSGGPQEVVADDVSGLLVPVSNPQALAGALKRLIASPELRAKLGAAARTRVASDFSLESNFKQYATLYQNLLRIERRPDLHA